MEMSLALNSLPHYITDPFQLYTNHLEGVSDVTEDENFVHRSTNRCSSVKVLQ